MTVYYSRRSQKLAKMQINVKTIILRRKMSKKLEHQRKVMVELFSEKSIVQLSYLFMLLMDSCGEDLSKPRTRENPRGLSEDGRDTLKNKIPD